MHAHVYMYTLLHALLKEVCLRGYSARIGRQEDDEEAHKEATEQARKAKSSKKGNKKPKQRKLDS